MPAKTLLETDPTERVLDIERRLRSTRGVMAVTILLAVLASTPWLGTLILVPYLLGMLGLILSDRFAYTCRRPQIVVFAGMFANVVACGTAAAVSGGVKSPLLFLLVVPIAGLTIRYHGRALLAAVVGSNLVAVAACVAPGPDAFIANPTPLLFLLASMNCVGIFTMTTQRIESYHRTQAVIDPLTGLFNRSSLALRFFELREQALATRQSLSVIVCDLDHFKHVNDEHGHATGDAVLKDVAYIMRKVLRHGDLVYRVGGEEFVILLPGLEMHSGVEAAQRLRVGIADSRPAGVLVTMSLGVATLEPEHRDWADVYRVADARLYEAKRRGRNEVYPAFAGSLRIALPVV
jgi:diguanylate cyclase (GGDEF)-like protein